MSALFTIVFFGVRHCFSENELPLLEARQHPLQIAARSAQLDFEWGNYGIPDEKWLGFIGRHLQRLGSEDSSEFALTAAELNNLEAQLASRLSSIGLSDHPRLWVQLHPDG